MAGEALPSKAALGCVNAHATIGGPSKTHLQNLQLLCAELGAVPLAEEQGPVGGALETIGASKAAMHG